MNYSKQVLDMLGVEPNERFELTDHTGTYWFDEYLVLHNEPCYNCNYDKPDSNKIAYILRGNFDIIKKGVRKNEVAI